MAKIEGKLLATEVSTDGTTWKTLICETSSGANMERDTQEAPRTKCDAAATGKELTPQGYSWSFDFDAMVDDSPTSSQVTYGDMLGYFLNATKVHVRRQYNSSGSEFYLKGQAYLTSLSESAEVEGFITFTGTFSGTGDLDITAPE
jgi:hypothetical protein